MKRLECGVGYEDGSTQPSDLDDWSEEDLSMPRWQQMTQTFGMGKGTSCSTTIKHFIDQSTIDSAKEQKPIVSMPKSLKPISSDYFLRGSKKASFMPNHGKWGVDSTQKKVGLVWGFSRYDMWFYHMSFIL
ncbi:hypothetical protein PsorP6_008139 [Peronosclerospora sorghi]|uniref:Uncharacterized protein n=1 Tax=Peronosclerospora sorghi TaxID=230839 RepID=A0ACC0W6S9_9STRA|nr:hypothetical protein PsorP6_008139 [Peronosclerospora sorghi]